MSDSVDNLVLENLRAIRSELAELRSDVTDIKTRMSRMETSLARVGRDVSSNYSEQIEDRHVVDRLAERVARIEKRLELID